MFNETQPQLLAKLKPIKPLKLDNSSAPKRQRSCVNICREPLRSAWHEATTARQTGDPLQCLELPSNRNLRILAERQLADFLAHQSRSIMVEYSYASGDQQHTKVMLSKGACELLALHFCSADCIAEPFSKQELQVIEHAEGLAGEFREVAVPRTISVIETLMQKLRQSEVREPSSAF